MAFPKTALTYAMFPGLLRHPRRSPAAIQKIRERKLRRLVRRAYRHVPYYRSLFDSAGLKPQDIKTLDDLGRIPLTSKSRLRDLPDSEKTAANIDLSRCGSFTTSGTSGIPLRSYFSRRDSTMKNLGWIRAFVHVGIGPRQRMAAFVGKKTVKAAPSWYERLGLWRRKEISSWEKPETWVEELRRWKPDVISGYVMTLRILAEYLEANALKDIKPRAIIQSSALLDGPSRKFLEDAFQCPVIDIYGSDEGGCLAWECRVCGGYHISEDTVILEILKNGRPAGAGEVGDVVITNLHSEAMPFIRYRQDDIAAHSERTPSCGRRFPLLEKIEGRIDDFIRLSNGEKISPHPFYHCLDPVPGVKRWRLTQVAVDRLRVEIAADKDFADASRSLIDERLRGLVKNQMKIEIEIVDSIPVDPARKFRTVSSQV